MGAVKNLYMTAEAELFEELLREPSNEEVEERVRSILAKLDGRGQK